MVFKSTHNQHKLQYSKLIGCEQEFNTLMFGIKGNIDATVLINANCEARATALEIKTGKNHSTEYISQVLIYSLLLTERFANSNPDNILLYLMDADVKQGFEYVQQNKEQLDRLILNRNELAKWQQLNLHKLELFQRRMPEVDESDMCDQLEVVKIPPMITNSAEC